MNTLADGLLKALDGATDVLVVYSDLVGVPVFRGSPEATLRAHASALLAAAGDRTVLVATFNYDWCEMGRYDPQRDPAQVGQLNEYLRTHHGLYRTRTPVFNFSVVRWCSRHIDVAYVDRDARDPFGPKSIFRWLIDTKATVLAYGCPLHNASALHVAESEAGVPYRYVKPFPGHIEGQGPFTLFYSVKPREGVEYDWGKVDEIIRPAFKAHDVGGGAVHVGRADAIHRLLVEALEEDEHAFLTEPPIELYERHGKPLTFDQVEVG